MTWDEKPEPSFFRPKRVRPDKGDLLALMIVLFLFLWGVLL